MIGDGWIEKHDGKTVDIRSGKFAIKQNDIINAKIYNVVNKLFDNVKLCGDDKLFCGYKTDIEKIIRYWIR